MWVCVECVLAGVHVLSTFITPSNDTKLEQAQLEKQQLREQSRRQQEGIEFLKHRILQEKVPHPSSLVELPASPSVS